MSMRSARMMMPRVLLALSAWATGAAGHAAARRPAGSAPRPARPRAVTVAPPPAHRRATSRRLRTGERGAARESAGVPASPDAAPLHSALRTGAAEEAQAQRAAAAETRRPRDRPPAPSAADAVIDAQVGEVGTSLSSILGKEVTTPKGEDLGRVVDVLADAEGHVRVAIIDFGGFLGVGTRRIAVDWPLLRFDPTPATSRSS